MSTEDKQRIDAEEQKIIDEVSAMGIEGPTVEEYLEGLGGNQRIISELNTQLAEKDKEIEALKQALRKASDTMHRYEIYVDDLDEEIEQILK